MNLPPPTLALRVAPLATSQVPVRNPPVYSVLPLATALAPVKLPPCKERLAEVKLPLKVALLVTATTPAPVNGEPALKLTLAPLKLSVAPVAALRVPALLTKAMLPIVPVRLASTFTVPVLVN